MKTLLKISWRNVWRNKARSIVIIMAIGFGLWGGIFATALMTGMIQQQFNSSIKNQVSHIQIHTPEYVKEKQTEFSIAEYEKLFSFLKSVDIVNSFSGRTIANGMLATASMTAGVEIVGIDPEMEKLTTSRTESLIDGDYFESVSRNPVLIGARLAEKLKIENGNRIILTFQDLNGDITSASFRVCGIYRTSNTMNDEKFIYVKQSDLEHLLGDSLVINEIAILLHDIENVNDFRTVLSNKFSDYEIRTWAEISPDLSFMSEFSGMALMILIIIILFAMAFGLLNTMLMTIFERTRELGVLMSVGMGKFKIFSMILLETCILVITGSLFGSLIGSLTVNILNRTGLDLSGLGADVMSDYGFDAVIYPVLDGHFFVNLAILVLITAVLAAIYPAYKALKLNPAEAVRKE